MSFDEIIKWCNDNSGFLQVIIWGIPIIFLWIKGTFSSLANWLKNTDEESRITLLERNLKLKEKMRKDFLKPNYFQECYDCRLENSIREPTKKFISPEFLIRNIFDDTYPEWPDTKGISPHFILFPENFYYNGISFSTHGSSILVDEFGNWTISELPREKDKENHPEFTRRYSKILLYIPFSNIVTYDLEDNEYGHGPTIFCKFDGVSNSPYEKTEYQILNEDGMPDFARSLPQNKRFKNNFLGWKKVYFKRWIHQFSNKR